MIADIFDFPFQFDNDYHFFCTHSAVCQILTYYKVNNPDTYLNTSVGCKLQLEQDVNYRMILDLYPVLNEYKDYCTFYKETEESKAIIEADKYYLEQGSPIIMGVDSFMLPYHPNYKKKHGAHAIFLVDYNDGLQEATIIDRNSAFYTFKGTMSYNDLKEARFSDNEWNGQINSGGKISRESIVMHKNKWLNLKQTALDNLKYTINAQIENYYKCYKEKDAIYGLSAVLYLINKIDYILNRSNRQQEDLLYLHAQLMPQVEMKKLLLRNLLFTKRQFSIENQHFNKVCTQTQITVSKWNILLKLLLKASYKSVLNQSLIDDIQVQRKEICELENNLGSYYNKLRLFSKG